MRRVLVALALFVGVLCGAFGLRPDPADARLPGHVEVMVYPSADCDSGYAVAYIFMDPDGNVVARVDECL